MAGCGSIGLVWLELSTKDIYSLKLLSGSMRSLIFPCKIRNFLLTRPDAGGGDSNLKRGTGMKVR